MAISLPVTDGESFTIESLIDWLHERVGAVQLRGMIDDTGGHRVIAQGTGWQLVMDWTEKFYVTGPIQPFEWRPKFYVEFDPDPVPEFVTEFLLRWN